MKMIKKTTIIKAIVLLVTVLLFIFVEPLNQGLRNMIDSFRDVESVRQYIRSFGGWAIAISISMMIVQSIVAPIPAFFITFANAGIWGWWQGAMIGAAICFGISRVYGRGVAEKFASKLSLEEIEIFFEKYGKNTIFVATGLGQIPATLVYSYAAAKFSNPSTFVTGLLLLFGLSALVYTVRMIWMDKNKKAKKSKQ